MRNYVMMFWERVYYSVDDISFNFRVWVGQTEEECGFHRDYYLNFLQKTFDPAYHIWQQQDYMGVQVPGPVKYYFEMNKANLWDLLYGPQVGSPLVAQCAATVFGSQAFGRTWVPDSPRKTWSHNE